MADIYLLVGAHVRLLNTTYTQANHTQLMKWMKSDPSKRRVVAFRDKCWYAITAAGWATRGVPTEPKEITLARTIDAIAETNWIEVQDEISPDTFFGSR